MMGTPLRNLLKKWEWKLLFTTSCLPGIIRSWHSSPANVLVCREQHQLGWMETEGNVLAIWNLKTCVYKPLLYLVDKVGLSSTWHRLATPYWQPGFQSVACPGRDVTCHFRGCDKDRESKSGEEVNMLVCLLSWLSKDICARKHLCYLLFLTEL